MTEQQLLLLQVFGVFGTVFLLAVFIWVSDICSEHECGPIVLRRVGRFFCGTFRRAMTTYGMFDVVAVAFITFLCLWPYISGSYENAETTLIGVLLTIFLTAPTFFYDTYKGALRRFGRRETTDRERAWEEAWEQLPTDEIVGAVETAFRQSTPDRTAFKELVHRLLTKYEKMRQGRTRNSFARAFRQLLARDDECGEAFGRAYREWYAEWYAARLQNGD